MVRNLVRSYPTETSFIPLHSGRQAQQSPAIQCMIGAVVLEESVMGFSDQQQSIFDM